MEIFCSEKAAGLFHNQGGDAVCFSTLVLPGGTGEEAASWSCSCLGPGSYPVLWVRNLGAAHATALCGARTLGRPQGSNRCLAEVCNSLISCSWVLQIVNCLSTEFV